MSVYKKLVPALLLVTSAASCAAGDLPIWAYPVAEPDVPGAVAPKVDDSPRHVPGSTVALRPSEFEANKTDIPDWFPLEHPQMPPVVLRGREPAVWACAYCHLPNGAGRPENTSLAGLTPSYFKQQISDFRSGLRQGSEPRRAPQNFMIALAKSLTDEEVAQAAGYFSKLKPESFVKVVETDTVPKTYVAGAMLSRVIGAGNEPLGDRIIEIPEDLSRAENRDPKTPYIAYVPVGSIARGAALVAAVRPGAPIACAVCHGPGLRGLADIPRLAGRSPSYIMRELYDFKAGTRTGASGLMKPVAAGLSTADMVDVSAYVASLAP